MSELQHLIKMANQIAQNIGIGASEEEIIDKVENHIRLFWAPPMRKKICDYIETDGSDLHPFACKALLKIKGKLLLT
jgi:formate dehydrogenase subunit delta